MSATTLTQTPFRLTVWARTTQLVDPGALDLFRGMKSRFHSDKPQAAHGTSGKRCRVAHREALATLGAREAAEPGSRRTVLAGR